MNKSLPTDDLDWIAQTKGDLLQDLSNAHFLVYGGTGFIGRWLVATLVHARKALGVNIQLTIVTRDTSKAANKFNQEDLSYINIIDFNALDSLNNVSHIIFGATSATDSKPEALKQSLEYARIALGKAKKQGNTPIFIHLSSGAATKVSSAPNSVNEVPTYGQIKNEIERLVVEAHNKNEINGSNPRLYAFYGPLLPLDDKYAFGNFMQNALSGQNIILNGNSQTTRSYMYPTDLIINLLELSIKPTIQPIEIGGTRSVTMLELAETMTRIFVLPEIVLNGENQTKNVYIPDPNLNYVKSEGLPLDLGIKKWQAWIGETSPKNI